ncbi:MAG: 3-deoxy-manno-octulosonate cytidylyltransferase [Deltaproteobacteria bacterium]|nr:3-deoxy-manno-octulosonate cytidylyltransferase [Deltaproteobacteria bacterium]
MPEKVLIEVAGKTVLQHVWERARDANPETEPIIATDDERVADAGRRFKARVVMTSSKHLCGSERVAAVAKNLESEIIVNLQADELLIDPGLIAKLPGLFDDPGLQMATAVTPLSAGLDVNNPSLVKAVLDDRQNVLYFSRLPIPFSGSQNKDQPAMYGHLGIYAFRRDFLLEMFARPQSSLEKMEKLEQLRVLQAGYRIRAKIWPSEYLGLNTLEDLARARKILEGQ